MNEIRSGGIVFALSIAPYVLVAWGYTALSGRGTAAFWTALAFLFGARLFFAVIEFVGGVLVWRFWGRKVMVDKILHWLKSGKFPARYYEHDTFLAYLTRIEDDYASSTELKCQARAIEGLLAMLEASGILAGMRAHSASEIALVPRIGEARHMF
jgi:hypothetical protein